MKNTGKDILSENHVLKETPYSVPEGYFESMKKRLMTIPAQRTAPERRNNVIQLILHSAIAAALAVLLAGGGFFLGRLTYDRSLTMTAQSESITDVDIIE